MSHSVNQIVITTPENSFISDRVWKIQGNLQTSYIRERTGLGYDTHPIEVRRVCAVGTLDDNTVRSRSAEPRQLNRIALRHILIPIVTRQREADYLRCAPIDADRCITLVVAVVTREGVADITVDVVEAYGLSSLAGADIA